MKLSLSWLREYVAIPELTSNELIHDLTMHTAELEGVEDMKEKLSNIVVGKVLTLIPHENADKLRVATVDIDGSGKGVQIVCGAANLEKDHTVAVALIGAKVFDGSVTIEKSKIRGVESNGMICAEDEIGLGGDHDGIMVLNDSLTAGTPLADALNLSDVILDIDNKAISHRPDLWCHFGFAREFAAIYGADCSTEPKFEIEEIGTGLDVKISTDDCKRYIGAVVSGIKIEPSPEWMQKRLESCGIKSISNIVDITNYVMLELGQPMHAFDYSKVEGSIEVRNANTDEELITLDEVDRKLSNNFVVISDSKSPLALAGVMGGLNSQINDNSEKIIFEAATFSKKAVRDARIATGLNSESSNRFEKGLSPVMPAVAMNRALELVKEICTDAKVEVIKDASADFSSKNIEIVAPLSYYERVIGSDIGSEKVCELLKSLRFEVEINGDDLSVGVPYYRQTDVAHKEDIAEELVRRFGLENLEAKAPVAEVNAPNVNKSREFEWKIKDLLASYGMYEVITYDFVNEELMSKCRLSTENSLEVMNALTADATHLASSLIPNLILNVSRNLKNCDKLSVFRVGKVFSNEGDEDLCISGAISESGEKEPYYKVKFIIDQLFNDLGLSINFKRVERDDVYHPGRVAEILCGKKNVVGVVGELHPSAAEATGIKSRVGIFELDFPLIFNLMGKKDGNSYKNISQFPTVERDLSMMVDSRLEVGKLVKAVLNASGETVSCEVFDVYSGDGVKDGEKSVALRYILGNDKKTLAEEDINKASGLIMDALTKAGANVRTQ